MCLVVKEIPATTSDGIIVKCYKQLTIVGRKPLTVQDEPYQIRRYQQSGRTARPFYVTSFQLMKVPKNGWLLPKHPKNVIALRGNRIEDGVIHAYCSNSFGLNKKAYAFEVVAYGKGDLVAKALYIPDCDFSDKKEITLKEIQRIMKVKTKTTKHLEVFPQLCKTKSLSRNNSNTSKRGKVTQ